MGDDSDWERWRVEHARDPDTESTPLTAAAAQAGRTLFYQHLGEAAVAILRDAEGVSHPRLESDEAVVALGQRLADAVDREQVPSRLELHQDLAAAADGSPGLCAEEVDEMWRAAIVEQVGLERVAELVTLVADDS